jgi:molybdopterin adenylyltransferase
MTLRIAILVLSDRSAHGERADLSGPAIAQICQKQGWQVRKQAILPDEIEEIQKCLIEWADSGDIDIIFTSGGTGFAPRDITPEATQAVIERSVPGLPEVMRAASLKTTPHGMLSRAAAGIRKRCLIVNLPGSPKAVVENIEAILQVLPHAVQLLNEDPQAESNHFMTGSAS